jgi:hypothetical protein
VEGIRAARGLTAIGQQPKGYVHGTTRAAPECGCGEIRDTERFSSIHGTIDAFYCGACD